METYIKPIILFTNPIIIGLNGLDLGPEGMAHALDIVLVQVGPGLFNGGLQTGHVAVVGGTGCHLNLRLNSEVMGDQVWAVGRPDLLEPESLGPQLVV